MKAILYYDKDYLSQIRGGITSIGIGLVASISIGWERSLRNLAWKKLLGKTERIKEIYEVSEEREALIEGYIYFLDYEYRSMEGVLWIPAILSSKPIRSKEITKDWILVYFKKDSFEVPLDLWPNTPIRVYGTLVPIELCIRLFNKVIKLNCFVKARAAAYIERC